jgi:hypothetical protein
MRRAGVLFARPLTLRREKEGGAMTAFLFVTAAVALLAGLVGLIAGHVPRTRGRQQGHVQPLRHAHRADAGSRV